MPDENLKYPRDHPCVDESRRGVGDAAATREKIDRGEQHGFMDFSYHLCDERGMVRRGSKFHRVCLPTRPVRRDPSIP